MFWGYHHLRKHPYHQNHGVSAIIRNHPLIFSGSLLHNLEGSDPWPGKGQNYCSRSASNPPFFTARLQRPTACWKAGPTLHLIFFFETNWAGLYTCLLVHRSHCFVFLSSLISSAMFQKALAFSDVCRHNYHNCAAWSKSKRVDCAESIYQTGTQREGFKLVPKLKLSAAIGAGWPPVLVLDQPGDGGCVFFSMFLRRRWVFPKNRDGPPKWMVNIMENPYWNGWFGYITIFGNIPYAWKKHENIDPMLLVCFPVESLHPPLHCLCSLRSWIGGRGPQKLICNLELIVFGCVW